MDRSSPQAETSRSLSFKFVAMVLVFVITTGVLMGAAITLAGARIAAEERRRSLEYASAVVAGSLIGAISDQEPERIEAQLEGILSAGESYDIECIRIMDATGAEIAETEHGCTCDDAVEGSSGTLFALFTEPQVVEVPIEVDGLKVAQVSVQFQAVGLEASIYEPMRITALILILAMVVTAAWGGWMVVRTVVEPVTELQDAASRIARGDRDIALEMDSGDEIGELASALNDMTKQLERKEGELLRSYATLEDAYDEKADLAQRLERTMEFKSDFVAVASHEIRSPLAVIQLYSEMVQDQEFGDVSPQLAEAIESIVSAVGRLSTIVSGLMDVALLERGLMSLEFREISLCDLVDGAVADAGVLGRSRGVFARVVEEAPSEVTIRGDAVRLRQIIDNLLSNAIKYSPDNSEIKVTVTSEDAVIEVAVIDEGPGVPEDSSEVLFELFGRADTSDRAAVSGLGLGLPISRKIAEAHGGGLRYERAEGSGGSVFTLWLPTGGVGDQVEGAEIEVLPDDE